MNTVELGLVPKILLNRSLLKSMKNLVSTHRGGSQVESLWQSTLKLG